MRRTEPPGFSLAFWRTVQMEGVWRACCDAAIRALKYVRTRDTAFDRRHGTQTHGMVAIEDLGIGDAIAKASAVAYTPSPARVTRWMLRALGVNPTDYAFVDIGCGKGRVVLVAAELPFREIVGVEISADLAREAEANLARYRGDRLCDNVRILRADARAFALPKPPAIFHFYHPFGPVILRDVLRRIEDAVTGAPGDIRVIYLAPRWFVGLIEETFARAPRFRKVGYHPTLSGDYDWLVYAIGSPNP